jgi:hypothetical protein
VIRILWLLLTAVALVAWDLFPGQAPRVLQAYVLASAGLAIWGLLRSVVAAHPPSRLTAFDQSFVCRTERPERPEELERVERTVAFGRSSALDTHARLRPLLREIADAHMAAQYGRGLDAGPDAVRTHLGDRVSEAIRPREEPAERHGPGMDLRELSEVVTALEDLARRR